MKVAETSRHSDVLHAIPEPQKVRARLQENLRERRLLRQLLKISERALKESVGSNSQEACNP